MVALAIVFLAGAPATPARASWMVPGYPHRPKDFALIKHEGVYHLFYIRHNVYEPPEETQNDLGHAISSDLWNWTQLPAVIPARDSSWDCTHIWAPSVVEQDGVFYLFYTGVSSIPGVTNDWQRIGVATSTDLMQWNRMDVPAYACTNVPWTVCDSTRAIGAFRDPFVMPDPAQPGQWLMYYSTHPASDSSGMVVGMAASSGDLTDWSDIGPLWITHRDYTYNALVESAHLFLHDGLWYLFYTTDAGQPITFCTGPDPVGAPETWTYRGRLGDMLGENTQAWIASEHLADGLVDYYAFVVADRVVLMRIEWGQDGQFSLVQPDTMHVTHMAWDSTYVHPGNVATLAIVAVNWTDASADLEAIRVRSDGSEVPVPPEDLGLPASVPLTGGVTPVPWTARWQPDPADTCRTMRLLVRLADRTASAPVLEIAPLPPPCCPAPDEDGPDSGPVRLKMWKQGLLRALARPLGAEAALLVDLEEAAPARIDIYDVQGRRVRALANRRFPAGATVVPWDGRDSGGWAVEPGVYFARLRLPSASQTVRLVRLP
jgi:hypothetical protein